MLPPLQNDALEINPNVAFSNSIASFRFATAIAGKKNVLEITTAVPCERPSSEIGVPFTQQVEREYMTHVPHETIEDGEKVTRYREEKVKETISVTRIRPAAAVEANVKPKVVEQSYTVMIPYTEVDQNGVTVQRSRVEKRKRLVFDDELVPEVVPDLVVRAFPMQSLKCYDRNGEQIPSSELYKRFRTKKPVILVNESKFVTPYFKSLLDEHATFIIEPKQASAAG